MSRNPRKQKRRPTPLGTRVFVCGEQVSSEPNLICLLPVGVPHNWHTSLAIDTISNPAVTYFVQRKEGSNEIEWRAIQDAEDAVQAE